jgi:hypothetical protein
MARIALNLFTFAQNIFSGHAHATAFTATRFLYRGRDHRPILIFMALLLSLLFSVSARAQNKIVVMEKDRRPLTLPTTEVTRIVGVGRKRESIRSVPMNLEVGDELVGNSGSVIVKLSCYGKDVLVSGKFQVRLLPTAAHECNLDFRGKPGAAMNVTANGRTNILSPPARLGTARTIYKVEITGQTGFVGSLLSRIAMPRIWAFQDEVFVESPFFSGKVEQGKKLVIEGTATPVIAAITLQDTLKAAEVYAAIDIVQVKVLPATSDAAAALFARLTTLHQEVLAEPDNAATTRALKKVQEDYGIPVSDPGPSSNQAQQNTTDINLTLKPGAKVIANIPFMNKCKKPVRIHFALEKLSFARFLSAADPIVISGKEIGMRVEFDAANLQPGTYSGVVVLTCLECPKGCEVERQHWQVTLQVE